MAAMATETAYYPKEIDVSKIKFSEVMKNKMGGNVVYLSYEKENKPLRMQIPKMYAPFGLNVYDKDKKPGQSSKSEPPTEGARLDYGFELSFKDMESDKKLQRLHKKVKEIDQAIVNAAVEHHSDWFGMSADEMNAGVASVLCKKNIRPASDSKYADKMKVKIRNIKNAQVFDADTGEQLDAETAIVAKSDVRAIIEIRSVFFVNKSFGVTWELVHMEIKRPEEQKKHVLRAEEDDDSDDEDFEPPAEASPEEEQSAMSDSEEEIEPVKPPPRTPAKRGAKKA